MMKAFKKLESTFLPMQKNDDVSVSNLENEHEKWKNSFSMNANKHQKKNTPIFD